MSNTQGHTERDRAYRYESAADALEQAAEELRGIGESPHTAKGLELKADSLRKRAENIHAVVDGNE